MKKPHIKRFVIALRKKVKDQEQSSQPSQPSNQPNKAKVSMDTAFTAAFTGYKSSYPLYNSFILDSRATTHICNNHQRFKDFVTALEILLAGDSHVYVEGYGTV